MKIKKLIELLQHQLAEAAAKGEDPDAMEVTIYTSDTNYHNDYYEIRSVQWEVGTPTYATINCDPQEE